MPRPSRADFAGAYHHAYARGHNKQDLFRADRDRHLYLCLLGAETLKRGWRLLAYCLMTTHVHLLLKTEDANLSRGIQRMHSDYARFFNDRYGRRSAVFDGRFGSVVVLDDEQAWTAAAYIARNPVKEKMCASAEAWPWGSFGQVMGERAPGWLDEEHLLGLFSGFGGDPRESYARVCTWSSRVEEAA